MWGGALEIGPFPLPLVPGLCVLQEIVSEGVGIRDSTVECPKQPEM